MADYSLATALFQASLHDESTNPLALVTRSAPIQYSYMHDIVVVCI